MNNTIIVSVLSFLGTVIGSFGGMRLMSYRIEQLEKRVDKHNNVIERTYQLEMQNAVQDERITELERKFNG